MFYDICAQILSILSLFHALYSFSSRYNPFHYILIHINIEETLPERAFFMDQTSLYPISAILIYHIILLPESFNQVSPDQSTA